MQRVILILGLWASTAACAHEGAQDAEARLLAIEQQVVALQLAHYGILPDRSPEGLEVLHRGNDAALAQLRGIDRASLGRDSPAYDILKEKLEAERQYRICRVELWDVNHVSGWHLQMVAAAQRQAVDTVAERAQALQDWSVVPRLIDQGIENLRRGLKIGYSAPQRVTRRVIKQISGLVDPPVAETPLGSVTQRADARFEKEFAVVIVGVRTALLRYRNFLEKEYLPKARATLGVAAHPDGQECYRAALRFYTTLDRSASEVYEQGRQAVKQNSAIVADLGQRKFGTRDLPTIARQIKSAPDNKFASEEELLSFARGVLVRAREKTLPLFEHAPTQAVAVERFHSFMRGSGASGYYEPQPDPSQPAHFRMTSEYWSDYLRGDAEDHVAHETFPGHHLQYSIARDLERSPIAQVWHNAAYTEGWARYAEALAEEAGVYETDYARMSRRIWPARALVLDPGMHAFGWSRERILEFLAEAGRTGEDAEDLIDRMAAMPGFLTSYDMGALEIMALRDRARRELAEAFDIREFHRAVLGQGSVPLETLRRNVETWIGGKIRGDTQETQCDH